MLHTKRADRGMVVASQHLAAQAGLAVLRDGGNAIEAMIAAATTISVVYPHMNGLGGDGFWLIDLPGRDAPHCIMGVGGAGRGATIDAYRAAGLDAVPARGPMAACTVAGTVSAMDAAYRFSRSLGGTLPLDRLLEDATYYAEAGMPVTDAHCIDVAGKRHQLAGMPGWERTFLPDGRDPRPGDRLRQPALAETLRLLARDGLDSFYRGPLAKRIAADLAAVGAPVAREDLSDHEANETEPLSVRLSGARVFNTPPPTQGLASLMILAIFERLRARFGPVEPDSALYVHLLVEATKAAFAIRDAEVADPARMSNAAESFLRDRAIDRLAGSIGEAATPWPRLAAPGDTVWLGAADSNGITVSFIHSIYWEFGSGVVLAETGIPWQNRGGAFVLDEASPRALAPGRKPFHTNNPAFARFDDGSRLAYGTMGGEGQPQTQAAVFSRMVWDGMPAQDAVTRPRWLLGRTWGDTETALRVEDRFGDAVIDDLRARGHELRVVPGFDAVMGHAGALLRAAPDSGGARFYGGADPRGDGVVAAF